MRGSDPSLPDPGMSTLNVMSCTEMFKKLLETVLYYSIHWAHWLVGCFSEFEPDNLFL